MIRRRLNSRHDQEPTPRASRVSDESPKTPTNKVELLPPVTNNNERTEYDTPTVAALPADVAEDILEAGRLAAKRLREELGAAKFAKLPPAVRRGLIELGLTRAYGLPVKREVTVNLSSNDMDAVAASLALLAEALPEKNKRRKEAAEDIGVKE